ncbi:hypothetical protein DVA81_18305, partial [Acinetobacter baumannii]
TQPYHLPSSNLWMIERGRFSGNVGMRLGRQNSRGRVVSRGNKSWGYNQKEPKIMSSLWLSLRVVGDRGTSYSAKATGVRG